MVAFDGAIDDGDLVSVDLLCRNERSATSSRRLAHLAMNGIEFGQRLCLIVGNFNARNAGGETVNDGAQRAERRELFSRKLTCAHFPERVVRVVVVRVCTGVRMPAWFNSSGPGFGAGVGRASVLSFRRVLGSSSSFE